ncbi:MAG TPA: hypothetical protein PKK99_10700 [Bacteroidia bacterium]|nr:hypothetical protein [Bacteroidia bacterium]
MKKYPSLLFFFLACITYTNAGIWYVDPAKGRDSNPGTESLPLHSLTAALKIGNNSVENSPVVIRLYPGLYTLENRLDIQAKSALTNEKRYILEAVYMPDDTAWRPEMMPVIASVADTSENWGFPCSVGIMVRSSHVSLKGIKFTGNPNPNHAGFYYPVGREDTALWDLEISQCLFIGDRFSSPVQCGMLVHGNAIVVDHCVFYNCRNAVVYWRVDSLRTGCAFTHNLVIGAYQAAVWTAMPDADFQFHHNVITKSNFAWIKNFYNPALYSIHDCVISDNEHFSGEWQRPDTLVEKKFPSSDLIENSIDRNSHIIMSRSSVLYMQDEIPRDFMSLQPDSPGEKLDVGLFKRKK